MFRKVLSSTSYCYYTERTQSWRPLLGYSFFVEEAKLKRKSQRTIANCRRREEYHIWISRIMLIITLTQHKSFSTSDEISAPLLTCYRRRDSSQIFSDVEKIWRIPGYRAREQAERCPRLLPSNRSFPPNKRESFRLFLLSTIASTVFKERACPPARELCLNSVQTLLLYGQSTCASVANSTIFRIFHYSNGDRSFGYAFSSGDLNVCLGFRHTLSGVWNVCCMRRVLNNLSS